MRVPLESIQYLVDVFIEGGYAEEEDLDHLDSIHMWLREEEDVQRRAFQKRISRIVGVVSATATDGWVTEPRPFENPAEMPVNRDGEDSPLDHEVIPENRSTYTIVDLEGNQYFFTP